MAMSSLRTEGQKVPASARSKLTARCDVLAADLCRYSYFKFLVRWLVFKEEGKKNKIK